MRLRTGEIMLSIIASIIVGALIIWFMASVNADRDRKQQQYVDSLFRQSKQSITFDSIRTVFEKRLADSIDMVRKEIQEERAARRYETKMIRRETQRIRNLLDSIGPIERPDL